MMRLLVLAGLVASSVGCVESESPVKILFARPLEVDGEGCKVSEDLQSTGGSLDVSGDMFYIIAFDIESQLESTSDTVEGDPLATAERNDFFISSMVVSYSATPAVSLADEEVLMYGVIRAGTEEPTPITVNLIGPKAAEKLSAQVAPGSNVELLASIKFKGRVGSGTKYETAFAPYPISLYNSGFSGCATGLQIVANPCGGVGQGAPVTCATPDP